MRSRFAGGSPGRRAHALLSHPSRPTHSDLMHAPTGSVAPPHSSSTPDATDLRGVPGARPLGHPRRASSPGRPLATAAALALVLLTACARGDAAPEPPPAQAGAETSAPPASSAAVAWVSPRSADGVTLMEAPAEILSRPQALAAIAAPFSARVAAVHVRPGDVVVAGQPLIEVVMPEVVRAAGASVAASLRIQAYERQRSQLTALREQGMARLADLADVETRLAEARADRQSAAALLRVAGLEPDAASAIARSGMVALSSPIAGTVVSLQASVGEVSGAEGPPLARVAAPDGAGRIQARLAAAPPEGARFGYLPPLGPLVEVRMVGRAPQVDARDATITAWFEPVGADVALTAGQSGRLQVLAGPDARALTVPARAITFRQGLAHVWVRADAAGAPQPLAVEVLSVTGSEALVRAGALTPGSRVAANAAALETPVSGHD